MKQKAQGLVHSFIYSDLRSNISGMLECGVSKGTLKRRVPRIFTHLSAVTEWTILAHLIFFSHLNSAIAHPGQGVTPINGCACLLTAASFQGEAQTTVAGKAATGRKQLKPHKGCACEKGYSQVCVVICRQKQREATGY